ncbi:MAG: tRNA pseudouridine(55) synthase TruB [Rhodospirillaceae bacterium]|nr:tRNA pseudouridine(55) synthase TruB [Rhodospirillaceae bacterium]
MARKRRGQPISGWLALDKPHGLTSTQALGKARRLMDAAKAGHGGTLDPLATGILPIAFGDATKTVSFAMDSQKTYHFDVIWGAATTTDDLEGEVTETSDVRPTPECINSELARFIGQVEQIPPQYSAIKVNGQRAYDLARDNQKVDLKPRTVRIDRFEYIDSDLGPDQATFEVDCGKGTYIRALVRDLAISLGTFGHIAALRRVRCGPFDEKMAISLDKLEALGHKAAGSGVLLPVETVLDDIPALALTEEEARRMSHGQSVSLFAVANRTPISGLTPGAAVQAVCGDRLIALATVADGLVKPVRVLNS